MDVNVFEATVKCDTSELDKALEKMERLVSLSEQAKAQGLNSVAPLVAIMSATGSQRKLSRRSLFRFLLPSR